MSQLPRSRAELARAAAEAEAWLAEIDLNSTPLEDAADLRAIGEALRQAVERDAALAQAVARARAAGRSWGLIGLVLGVSRQAARQRFGTSSQAEDNLTELLRATEIRSPD